MATERFRNDIEGFRGWAVLAVLLFHADMPWLPGGYVGVDAFFVISGFLITRLISRQVAQGTFSFKTFYVRRVRRLLPALFFTVALTIVASWWLFPAVLHRTSAISSITAIFSISNLWFFNQSGYFDQGAHLKPLLHTWSLGVEEQFYFVWPALLVVLLRKKNKALLAGTLGALALISLIAGEWFLGNYPSAVFFLTPFRLVEFAVGAAIVPFEGRHKSAPFVREGLLAVGLLTFLGSCFLYTPETRFPGWTALIPCVGAALCLHAGDAPRLGRLFDNPILRFLGRVSYSAYLVHWPLYVFYRYTVMRPMTSLEGGIFLVISFALATGSYYLVEEQFRKPSPTNNIPFLRVLAALALSLGGMALASTKISAPHRQQDELFANVTEEMRLKRGDFPRSLPRVRRFVKGKLSQDKPNLIVIGNSHVPDGVNIVRAALGDEVNYLVNWQGSCPPYHPSDFSELNPRMARRDDCKARLREIHKKKFYEPYDIVVISVFFQGKGYNIERATRYFDFLLDKAGVKKLIVVGKYMTLRGNMYENAPSVGSIDRYVAASLKKGSFYGNPEFKSYCERRGCLFIDKKELACDGDHCTTQIDGVPFTWDHDHLSYEFGHYLGQQATPQIREYLGLAPLE